MTDLEIADLFCSLDLGNIQKVFEYYADKGEKQRLRIATDILWMDYDMYPHLIDYVAYSKIPSIETLKEMYLPVKDGYLCMKEVEGFSKYIEPLPFYLIGQRNTLEYISTHSESIEGYDFSEFTKLRELTLYGNFVPESVSTIPNLSDLNLSIDNPSKFKYESVIEFPDTLRKIDIDYHVYEKTGQYVRNSDDLKDFISSIPKLERIELCKIDINDLIFKHLPEKLFITVCTGIFDLSVYPELERKGCYWKTTGGDVNIKGDGIYFDQ